MSVYARKNRRALLQGFAFVSSIMHSRNVTSERPKSMDHAKVIHLHLAGDLGDT